MGFDDVQKRYPNANLSVVRKNTINGLRRKKKIGDLPPVFPNGWFIILETDNLPKRTTKEINVLGNLKSSIIFCETVLFQCIFVKSNLFYHLQLMWAIELKCMKNAQYKILAKIFELRAPSIK